MTEFPSQSSIKHIPLKQAEPSNCDKLRKRLRTNDKSLRVRTGGYVAEFDKAFCAGADPHDLMTRIDALMEAGRILKDSEVSCVSRLTWNGRDVVVKRYNHRGFIHSLRHTLKRSRCRRAWQHGYRLGALGIATPRPLAYIERRRGPLVWSSYLVTEYIEGQRLDDFLRDAGIAEPRRLEVTREVIAVLEKLWKHRITHGDLKHTNVLITKNGPVLTDLDGMIVHRWRLLYRNKRAKDVERFLREMDGSLITRGAISQESASCRGAAGDFDDVRIDDWAIRVRRDFPRESLGNLLSAGRSQNDGQDRFLKVPSSDYARVFKGPVSSGGADVCVYVKRYLRRSQLDFAKHLLRASRARRAFEASLMLQESGFDTPAVLALFERRLGPFTVDDMLVTREIENAVALPQVLRDIGRRFDAEALRQKRALIRAFGRTIGRMHARGIFHGDLRLGNVLVVNEQQQWKFYFIDNERTKQFYHLPPLLRLKNLVQINMFRDGISNTDRMRFFTPYIEANPGIQSHASRWARKITAKTNRRLMKKYSFENVRLSQSSGADAGDAASV
jgi:tRNA A-37 threonylcarbamoyl transferase component Bud32